MNGRLNMHSPPWVGNEIALRASLMLGTNIQPVSGPTTIYSWADLGLAGTVEEGWGTSYIFVDQGHYSLVNVSLLLLSKKASFIFSLF